MEVRENVRENLFNRLNKCLNALDNYDICSVIPLLYVIVAHHEGHLVSIVGENGNIFRGKRHIQSIEALDGFESDLLKEIRTSVNEQYFEGQSAEAVHIFYDYCNDYIKEYYSEIIEHIISFYSTRGGKYAGMGITPNEVALLIANLIKTHNPSKIYDPCAGLCTYALQPELKDVHFVGQEINRITNVIAKVRLDASMRKNAAVFNGDSTLDWRSNDGSDMLASELPFGIHLNDMPTDSNRPSLLEDYILYKFINTPSLKKAVLMVSTGTCIRPGENLEIRKTLCENNWVDSVVKLPSGILSYSGVNTAIIVLDKERTSKNIKFVLANDCILNKGHQKVLDYQDVINRINNDDKKQSAIIPFESTFEQNYSLDPSAYVQEIIEVLPGQRIVKFLSIATKEKGIRSYEETFGRVLKPEHMYSRIAEMHTRDINIEKMELPKSKYVKLCSKAIIFNVSAGKFYIKTDEEPLFVPPLFDCFTIQENRCLPEYLVNCVINSKRFKEPETGALPRIDWMNFMIPMYESLESQKQIVQRIYWQEHNVLKKKLDNLQILSGKSSDLIHNLGVTFTKISAGIEILKNDRVDDMVVALNDNVQFALRQINSAGTDFEFVHAEKGKVNLYDTISKYIKAWGNFGYKSFDILPIKNTEDLAETKVEMDINLFYTMMDCIFINAHQHGFNKREKPENKLLVELEGVNYKGGKYIRIGISNNGNPLPDNFTIKDFVARGIVGINSSQDGIGGDHIYKIAHKFDGLVSIESDSEWLTFNILIPVYLTSNNTKFNDYECECL